MEPSSKETIQSAIHALSKDTPATTKKGQCDLHAIMADFGRSSLLATLVAVLEEQGFYKEIRGGEEFHKEVSKELRDQQEMIRKMMFECGAT